MHYFNRTLVIFFFLSAFTLQGYSQNAPKNESYALIFPKIGDGFAANILRFEKDSIVVFTNDFKSLAKKDIGKIILHAKKAGGKGFIVGSILGIYGVNYWLGTATGQPGGFLWDQIYGSRYNNSSYYYASSPFGAIGIVLLGIAAGGGIGFITDQGREANWETTFLFGGSQQMQDEEWEKAQNAIDHKAARSKFHLNISGGLVIPQVTKAYRDQLISAGYTSQGPYYSSYIYNGSSSNLNNYQGIQGSSDFNWLRSIGLSYSLTDNVQAGLTYAVLGEPSFVYTYTNPNYPVVQTSSTRQSSVGQRLSGAGYYATATYNSYLGKNEDFEFTITGGIGLASISFDLDALYLVDSSSTTILTQTDNISIRKNFFSGMLGASLSYYLYDTFSLGLKAEYFYTGSATGKAMPFVLLNEQQLNFGNADIGFTMGLHF